MVSTFEFIRIVNSQNLLPNDGRPCVPLPIVLRISPITQRNGRYIQIHYNSMKLIDMSELL